MRVVHVTDQSALNPDNPTMCHFVFAIPSSPKDAEATEVLTRMALTFFIDKVRPLPGQGAYNLVAAVGGGCLVVEGVKRLAGFELLTDPHSLIYLVCNVANPPPLSFLGG